jgi:REP element-mobilizing transposase RayT
MQRIKEVSDGFYHIVSRIVDRRMILDTSEKERIRRLLHQVETFCGVNVLTHAILDNHFHVLLHVPQRVAVSDDEFLNRLAALYDSAQVRTFATELKSRRAQGLHDAAESLKAQHTYRMYDLSEFMKTFKQRATQSYNTRHGRKGTLWEERFKSILIQGHSGNALATVAAYIDLNPVRARIVSDPKDYRFSGYGEAMAGSKKAQDGLTHVMRSLGVEGGWNDAASRYREYLYVSGQERGVTELGCAMRTGFDPACVEAVLEAGGELPLPELLRCRVRYFTDGVVLGGRLFVEDTFQRYRSRFGIKRQTGARPMKGGGFADLFTARRLRLAVITAPATG